MANLPADAMKDKLSEWLTKTEFLKEFQYELDAAAPGGDKSVLSLWSNEDRYQCYLQSPRKSDISKLIRGDFVFDIETTESFSDVKDYGYGSYTRDTAVFKYTPEYTYSLPSPAIKLIRPLDYLDYKASLDGLRDGFDEAAWMAYYYGANSGVLKGARNERTIMLLSPDRSKTEMHDSLSARDLVGVGWTRIDSLACEACHGVGTINGELCWHCEGEKLDPVLIADLT